MFKNFIKNIPIFLLINFCFILTFLIFFQFENKYFLQNEITPWDGSIFKHIIISLNDKSYNIAQSHFLEPHSSKLLFIYFVNFIKNYFNLSIIYSMFFLNILSCYILFLIIYYFLGYFKKNLILQLILTLSLFFLWNGQLRLAIYNPSYAFGFNTLLISLSTISIFFLIEKKNYYLTIIIPFIILISLQRYVVITSVILITLLLFYLNQLNTNYFFLNKFKNFFNLKRINNSNNIQKKFLILLSIIIICVFYLKLTSLKGGAFSFLKIVVKFSYFHLHPLEFLYSFYFAYGALIIVLVPNFIIPKLRKSFLLPLKKISKIQKLILTSIFLNSILLGSLGGDDSSRFLLWFSPYYILLFYLSVLNILNNFKSSLLLIMIPIYILGARVFVPGIPVYNFNELFLKDSQYAFTNYDDKYFYGPNFLKKFRKEIHIKKIQILPDYYNTNIKFVDAGIPRDLIDGNYLNPYIYPYKYRINDIPFPLGYIHNQKNALIDHPWHGKPWVRFALILQWLFIQIVYLLILKKNLKYKYQNKKFTI